MIVKTPYSLKNGADDSNEYYQDISNFTDQVLSESEFHIKDVLDDFKDYESKYVKKSSPRDLMVFEVLMIGVFWRAYIKRAVKIDPKSQKLLAELSRERTEDEELKPIVDPIRGVLATLILLPEDPKSEEIPELNVENLDKLFKWLEATGEFQEELKHLKTWMDFLRDLNPQESSSHLAKIFMFADWFEYASNNVLGSYTCKLEGFLEENREKHLWNEDIMLFTRKRSEYHLNMFGAEVMSREFRESFKSRPRKALLLPRCMCLLPESECMASETNLGRACTGCTPKCRVNALSRCGEKNEFEVYVVSHESSALSLSTQKDRDELGIVGVACIMNLISGGWKSESLGIPAQCVLLDSCGCRHWINSSEPTDISEYHLMKLLKTGTKVFEDDWPCSAQLNGHKCSTM
ncbi:DUF116 domain-containing protein [Methanobacterium aggregans]|uniref:DUF116 domain-containing protein n=1 Tax=Methanobacterium aggregans TaxID=1615586 RepID=UPI001AEB594D|nr:DUF116 domain-containing protein [Methanobacterium aggregans]MBP2046391.1 hypothetical protein [Methanobacterium aggregans]